MIIPIVHRPLRSAPNLDESDTALDQARGKQATAPEILRHLFIQSVRIADVLWFPRYIKSFRRAQLHFGSEFITRDSRLEARVTGMLLGVSAVQFRQQSHARSVT